MDLPKMEVRGCSLLARSLTLDATPFTLPLSHFQASPYNKGLSVDVVQVQGQHVVLAAHVHAVMVLILEEDSVVCSVEQKIEEVGGARGLKFCG